MLAGFESRPLTPVPKLPAFIIPPLVAALSLALPAPPAIGEEEGRWSLCPPPPPRPSLPPEGDEATRVDAGEVVTEGENLSLFTGEVVVLREGKRLGADRAIYDKRSDTLEVIGNVEFHSGQVSFTSERATLNLAADTGTLDEASYFFPAAHAFGRADRIEYLGSERMILSRATYTTCPRGGEEWALRARSIELDRGENSGEARDVTLRVGGVPLLYLPYINFPLEGRKTGLLVPSYGSSERNGTDIRLPWYWNIAPQRDATLTPRLITARGPMMMSEFRYLNEAGDGILQADYLPHDKLFGDSRSYLRYRHDQWLTTRWHAALDYREVSDPRYLEEIENTLTSASERYLERRLDLAYQGVGWSLLGRLQDYQPLDSGSEPYQRLPQLVASGAFRRDALQYDFSAEYVRFAHPTIFPRGSRLDLYQAVSVPREGAAWFITPRLAMRHTQYRLEGGAEGAPSRTLPLASLDAGLFFERDAALFGAPLLQTLEPRLYYLRVPFQDQGDLPLFDTAPMTFSFAQLFRENRFTGADRVNDANQLTAALTTRLVSGDEGRELLRASVGQIHYYSPRRVTLPGEAEERGARSDIAGELAARPIQPLEIAAVTRWDPMAEDARESSVRLRYRPDRRHIVDAAYRYHEAGATMNRDILVLWPLSQRWHFVGRWYYDLTDRRTLENVLGAEYQNCCWSVRVVGRDRPFLDERGTLKSNRSIYVTVELKGLANIGEGLESVIENGIVGN